MNRKLKQELSHVFDTPVPSRKELFLKQMPMPRARRIDFIISQLGYIRKRYWVLSMALLGMVLSVFYKSETPLTAVWGIASILPFLGLLSCTELMRSMSYNMTELELSCKYDFSGIMMVRLAILGTVQSIIFIVTLVVIGPNVSIGLWDTAIYLLMPFMLNMYITLGIINRLQSRETLPICAAVTGFISVMNAVVMSENNSIVMNQDQVILGIMFIILVGVIAYELKRMIQGMEELEWNL